VPSKNIIHSANVASYFRRSKKFGIIPDGFAIDMADVRELKRRMVRGLPKADPFPGSWKHPVVKPPTGH
jgi:pyruvate/2-oxoglutarate dehydrogenase complex dihydrolipoamide dehydrogenase (E3) component